MRRALFVWFLVTGCALGAPASDPIPLDWENPTQNVDGTPLLDLSYISVYWGPSSRNYTSQINVPWDPPSTSIEPGCGDWYISLTAWNSLGEESAYSNEILRNGGDCDPPPPPLQIPGPVTLLADYSFAPLPPVPDPDPGYSMATGFIDASDLADLTDFVISGTEAAGALVTDLGDDAIEIYRGPSAGVAVTMRYTAVGPTTEQEVVALCRAGQTNGWSMAAGVRVDSDHAGWFASTFGTDTYPATNPGTGIAGMSTALDIDESAYHWRRVRIETNGATSDLKIKMWPDGVSEPAAWDYEASHNDVQDAGYIGFGLREPDAAMYCRAFGYATDGETAPTEAVSGVQPVNAEINIGTSADPSVHTLGFTPTVGNSLIVGIETFNPPVASLTDDGGNTWELDYALTDIDAYIYRCQEIVTPPTTISLDQSGTVFAYFAVVEVSGLPENPVGEVEEDLDTGFGTSHSVPYTAITDNSFVFAWFKDGISEDWQGVGETNVLVRDNSESRGALYKSVAAAGAGTLDFTSVAAQNPDVVAHIVYESASQSVTETAAVTEALTAADGFAAVATVTAARAEAANAQDAYTTVGTVAVGLSEGVTAGDSPGGGGAGLIDISFDLTADSLVTAVAQAAAALSEGVVAGETWANSAVALAALIEAGAAADTVTDAATDLQTRAFIESTTAAAVFLGAADAVAQQTEAVTVGDAVAAIVAAVSSISGGVNAADQYTQANFGAGVVGVTEPGAADQSASATAQTDSAISEAAPAGSAQSGRADAAGQFSGNLSALDSLAASENTNLQRAVETDGNAAALFATIAQVAGSLLDSLDATALWVAQGVTASNSVTEAANAQASYIGSLGGAGYLVAGSINLISALTAGNTRLFSATSATLNMSDS